jgi:hypothetical protein
MMKITFEGVQNLIHKMKQLVEQGIVPFQPSGPKMECDSKKSLVQ